MKLRSWRWEIFLHYLCGNVTGTVLINEKEARVILCEKNLTCCCLEDGGRSYKPRDVGDLSKLEKVRKQLLPRASRRNET